MDTAARPAVLESKTSLKDGNTETSNGNNVTLEDGLALMVVFCTARAPGRGDPVFYTGCFVPVLETEAMLPTV
jgi:hypothetical protein